MNVLGTGAWRTVVTGFLTNFITFGLALNFSLFQEYYQNDTFLGQSASSISWVAGTLICLIHLGEIFVKPLTNKVGPRPLMFSGTVISAVSWIGASFVNDLYQVALLQGLLLGVGNAMVHQAAKTVRDEQQDIKTNAWHGAMAKVGSPLGGLVWSLVIPVMLRSIGLPWTFRAIGLISLFLFACASTIVMSPVHDPTGDESDAESVETLNSTGRYTVLVISLFFVNLGAIFPLIYLATVGVDIGLSRETAGYVVTVFHAASILGLLLWEALSLHIGRMYLMLAASTLIGIFMFFWIVMVSLPAILVFAVLFGLLLGPMLVNSPTSLLDIAGTKSNLQQTLTVLFPSLAFLIGAPIGGAVMRASDGGWFIPACVAGGSLLLGAALIVVSHAKLRFKRQATTSEA